MDKIKCISELQKIESEFRELISSLKVDKKLRNDSDVLDTIDKINAISVEI